jgi:pSer/pThr/pTyr-binding forkhead associated (FHA) protein
VTLEWTLLALRLLALAVLYAFLILIIYVVWRDLRTAAPAQQASGPAVTSADGMEIPAGYLRLVTGQEASLQPGATFPLEAHVTVGRAPDNHIVLSDTYVSSYHARLDRRDGEWWLTDLGSRNGTRLNDVPITKPVPLVDGDVIGLGRVELKLEIEQPD